MFQFLTLSFLPRPLALLILILGFPIVAAVLLLLLVVFILGVVTTSSSAGLAYQCDSAVGPNPSSTETVTFGAGATVDAADVPSTNPYAGMTTESGNSAWVNSCITAMNTAPYQLPPLQTANIGVAAQCARTLALQPSSGADTATLTRQVVYGASLAAGTGRCALPTAALPAQTACQQAVGSAALVAADALVLPDTRAGQAACGQRVDTSAVSAGDLVFWNYVDSAPTRMGIAIDTTEIVTDSGGQFVRTTVPSQGDVRVKRYLTSQ